MLVLTSNGLSSDVLIEQMKSVAAGLKKAVIITTASVGYKEKDWHIQRLCRELLHLGLSVDFFDFDTQDPRLLSQYDVIEINGGNPFYLLKSIRESNGTSIIKELAVSKIVIGISAGTIIFQKNIDLIAQYSPEMNQEVGLVDLSGLHVIDFDILPHYHRFMNRFERFEERAQEYEKANQRRVLRIDDGQAIFVKGETYTFI